MNHAKIFEDVGSFLRTNTAEDVFERQVISVLELMKTAPRYVLGLADQVPPDGLEGRVRRVAELVDRWGRFVHAY